MYACTDACVCVYKCVCVSVCVCVCVCVYPSPQMRWSAQYAVDASNLIKSIKSDMAVVDQCALTAPCAGTRARICCGCSVRLSAQYDTRRARRPSARSLRPHDCWQLSAQCFHLLARVHVRADACRSKRESAGAQA